MGNLIGQAAGYLPGYIPAIWLPQLLGRIKMQIIFCFMAMVIFAVWAGVVNTASTGGSFTLLIIGQLVIDGGVTATILILPTELWPTRVRATAFGVAAASGQCGAVLTAFAFGSAAKAMGLNGMFGLFAGLYLIIILVTFLVPETRDATLPELESDALYDKKWGHRRREALQRSNESKGEEEEAANSATLTCVSGKQAEA